MRHLLCLTIAIACYECRTTRNLRAESIVVATDAQVANCTRLTEVAGSAARARSVFFAGVASSNTNDERKIARDKALTAAADVHATHLVLLEESYGAGMPARVRGMAYRCDGAALQNTSVANAALSEVVGPGASNVRAIAVPRVAGSLGDAGLRAALTDVLVAVMAKRPNSRVITNDDIEAMLAHEKRKDVLGCEESASCYAEIGGALGVDALFVASVNNVGTTVVASFKLIDTRRAEVALRSRASLSNGTEGLVPVFEAAAKAFVDKLQPAN